MSTTTSQHSLWLEVPSANRFPPVHGDPKFDVLVVGGGIAGLTTALLLKRSGVRVGVIEAGRVGSGATGNNTAKVSALQSTVYSTINGLHGLEVAMDYAAASRAGVEKVAEIVASERIDCDLERRSAYTYAFTSDEVAAVDKEAKAAKSAGLPVREVSQLDTPFPVYGAISLDQQLRIHPLRYVQGLAAAVDGDGCQVFEGSRVLSVDSGRVSRVHTTTGVARADRVVIATHYPILDRGVFFARLEPVRSYAIAAQLHSGVPPTEMLISAGDPAW